MLILVGVTVNVELNGRLFENAKQATSLEKYVLGETGEGRLITDIISNIKEADGVQDLMFINEASTIPNAQTEVKAITSANDYTLYLKYENKAYRVEVDVETLETKTCELVYELTGREGKDLGEITGNSEYTGWTIIYDNGTSVEAVSSEVMRKEEDTEGLTLGKYDSTVDWTKSEIIAEANIDGEEGLTDIEKTIYSYNHAIETINTYCEELSTLPANNGVRSVGAREDKITKRYNGIPSDWENDVATKYNGKGKVGDTEYEQDLVRMAYWGVNNLNECYWMAVRYVHADSSYVYFDVGSVYVDGSLSSNCLWYVYSDGYADGGYYDSYAVCPVITINNL